MSKIAEMKADGKYAWTVRVGDKGQIVIPKDARALFGIEPGDTLLILGDTKQGMAIPPKSMTETVFASILSATALAGKRNEGE